MRINIRPFDYSDQDYETAVELNNLVWPERYETAEEQKLWDQERPKEYLNERLLAEVDGRPVAEAGYGETFWSYEPGKYWLSIAVHPDHQRRGIGSTLYDHIMVCLSDRPVRKLAAWTRDKPAGGVHFLERRGFQEVMRYPVSELDLTTFDLAPFAEKVQQVEADPRLEIKTLAQLLAEDPDCKPKLYDAAWEWMEDVPSPGPRTRPSYEFWEKRTFGNPRLLSAAWFLAVEDGRYVGISYLRPSVPGDMHTGLTAVSRSHRRRGLATALKVKAITYAQAQGCRRIITDNEENNPMYELNLQLGFRPLLNFMDFEKELDHDTEHSPL